jgi:predicted nucleic acid-binding protein
LPYAILDTAIYIGHWEHGLYGSVLEQIRRHLIVRQSSVVLSELHRGAKTKEALKLVEDLYKLAKPCWVPDEKDWWAAGKILRQLSIRHGWDARRIRDLQNDVLIALTARKYGAAVITANQRDFELLRRHVRFMAVYV